MTSASQADELCFGGNNATATVTPSGATGPYTYSWSPSGQTGSTATALTSQGYTCTITDANGCAITQTFNITQPTLVTVTTAQVSSTCGNPNGTATATPSGGTGTYNYLWSPGGQTTSTISAQMAGTYSVTVTDANGCSANGTITITNMGSPSASITSATNILCNGANTGAATVTVVGGTGTITYSWTPSGGTNTTANGIPAGTYTVTVTDSNGCQDTAQVTLTQPPLLTASASFSPVLCNGGNTGSANVIANGGMPAYSYSWSPTGGTASTANGLTAQSYTCTVTDANGCTTTASTTVTEPTQLVTTSSQVDELCFGGNTGSATVSPSGGTGAYTYSWSPSGGSGASATTLTSQGYTCTITDANGCSITQPFIITQPTQLVVSATGVDAHCNQSDGSATATTVGGTGASTFAWTPAGTGSTISNIPSGTYSVTATDVNGCTSSTTVTINNLNGVNASLGPVSNVSCNGGSNGSASITATGGNPAYTYSWTPNVSASNTLTGVTAGNYSVTVTDANGCTSNVTLTITEPPALAVIASAAPPAVCAGSQVSLSSTATGGVPAYTTTWNPGSMNGANQNVTPASSVTYTVTVVDVNGCSATDSVNVTVFPMPVATFSANITSGCAPVCVNFSDLSTIGNPGNIAAWTWDFGDGNTSTSQNPSHCYTNPGTYNVTLTVKSADGCQTTITMTSYINVFANPVAAFGMSPQPTTLVNSEIFFTDSSTNALSWLWSFGDLMNSTSTLENPSFTYGDATCYQVLLTATSSQGCVDTVSHVVCIGPDVSIFVPNTFTPNGDNHNETFFPVCIGIDPDHFEMWIYDRWGNMIYYTADLNNGWDGRVQGHPDIAQIDTYVWKINAKDLTGATHNLIGHVNLIK
ncbi:MAG: PKD domain-containing protein [Bacteroidetes bacterium]|nr:PKD domain-containing protein [Bacteroidota bacterium]